MSQGYTPSTAARSLIRAHTYAAFVGLLLSALFGLMVSINFHAPALLGNHAWDTWGRLRYDHTKGILYAWLGNTFIAFRESSEMEPFLRTKQAEAFVQGNISERTTRREFLAGVSAAFIAESLPTFGQSFRAMLKMVQTESLNIGYEQTGPDSGEPIFLAARLAV